MDSLHSLGRAVAKLRQERGMTQLQLATLCGLGQSAANPVLSTLRFFRDEYEAHVLENRCPAGVCKNLKQYWVVDEKCIGCTACARNCPAKCISGKTKEIHYVDQSKCIKCGRCFEVCRFDAVKKL